MKVSVAIPVYNDIDRIEEILSRVNKVTIEEDRTISFSDYMFPTYPLSSQ
jgi:glycosyltransferase involved in cell wall biosynthesis